METKTNRELTEQMLALETYTKVYLPKQLKDADAKIEETDARIPETTSEDAGKFIGVDANGDLAAVEAVTALPAVTASNNGSTMRVLSGQWAMSPEKTQGSISLTIGEDSSVTVNATINATQLSAAYNQYAARYNNISVTVNSTNYTIKVFFTITAYASGDPATNTVFMMESPTLRISDTIYGRIVGYIDRTTSANTVWQFIKV